MSQNQQLSIAASRAITADTFGGLGIDFLRAAAAHLSVASDYADSINEAIRLVRCPQSLEHQIESSRELCRLSNDLCSYLENVCSQISLRLENGDDISPNTAIQHYQTKQ